VLYYYHERISNTLERKQAMFGSAWFAAKYAEVLAEFQLRWVIVKFRRTHSAVETMTSLLVDCLIAAELEGKINYMMRGVLLIIVYRSLVYGKAIRLCKLRYIISTLPVSGTIGGFRLCLHASPFH
jgi:hypothetical protein